MDSSSPSVWEFILQNIGIIALLLSTLSVVLFALQQRREKKRLRVEGRQYYSKARSLLRHLRSVADGTGSLEEQDVYDEVMHLCSNAIDLGYREAECSYDMGRALNALGRTIEALKSFQVAARRDPCVTFQYAVALTYIDLRDYEAASREFGYVLEMTPRDPSELYLYGYARDWVESLERDVSDNTA